RGLLPAPPSPAMGVEATHGPTCRGPAPPRLSQGLRVGGAVTALIVACANVSAMSKAASSAARGLLLTAAALLFLAVATTASAQQGDAGCDGPLVATS